MSSKPTSSREFYWGIGITIAVTLISVWGSHWSTRAQISAQNAENQRINDSKLLREISLSVSTVREQLSGYVGMLLEVESCMKQRKASPNSCWRIPHSFDLGAARKAWAELDGSIRGATPFLSDEESLALAELKEVKASHYKAVDPLLPATTPKAVVAIRERTVATMGKLAELESRLDSAVGRRSQRR